MMWFVALLMFVGMVAAIVGRPFIGLAMLLTACVTFLFKLG